MFDKIYLIANGDLRLSANRNGWADHRKGKQAALAALGGCPVSHDLSHVHPLDGFRVPADLEAMGHELATQLRREKAIMGVFDEGCMGMYNAIIPDECLMPMGVFKERLSQASLYAAMR